VAVAEEHRFKGPRIEQEPVTSLVKQGCPKAGAVRRFRKVGPKHTYVATRPYGIRSSVLAKTTKSTASFTWVHPQWRHLGSSSLEGLINRHGVYKYRAEHWCRFNVGLLADPPGQQHVNMQ
jgi:hypothetical protein